MTHRNQVGRLPFPHAYPGWPGERVYANLDAALIRLDDVNWWTAQVFGIGQLDEVIDLNTNTISLDLIGRPMRAFGAGGGELVGEIQALFYRYRSIGGFDYVADLLIGPRSADAPLETYPGDSGTVWVWDSPADEPRRRDDRVQPRRFRPIAVQWGGHTLLTPGGTAQFQFALATCLSTICRVLDVEVVRDWNIGHREYWGRVGHYKIGAKACELVSVAGLTELMRANLERIAFGDEAIAAGELRRIDSSRFVPLADVPDFVWRKTRKKDDGNHFADMDESGAGEFQATTLLDLCEDPTQIDTRVWNRFYDRLEVGAKRGALPFRVWQIYDAMVGAVRTGQVDEFVCAAGILAHYVGDASQPLHGSYLHHGRPDVAGEARVHTVYEDTMMDRFAAEMVAKVNARLDGAQTNGAIVGGHAAAVAVVELMRRTIRHLPPMEIITAFNAEEGRARVPHMWQRLGDRTAACVADGCGVLARLWDSAWHEGGGGNVPPGELRAVSQRRLMALYNNPSFLPALRLREMEEGGLGVVTAGQDGGGASRARSLRRRRSRRGPR